MTYALYPFQLHRPGSVTEALELAAAHPGAPFLAGGTDLMVNLRKRLHEPEHVISLSGVDELRGARRDGDTLTLGALTPIAEVAANPLVTEHLPVLAEAAGLVAGPTLRRMGTLGGNLCLDTRCRYYNQSHFWRQANNYCLKKDSDVCHVAPGGSFCWAAFSADTPPALLMLGAEVELAGPEGLRRLPLDEFYGKDGRWTVSEEHPGGLRPGELLLRVHVPLPHASPDAGWQGVYEKLRVRDSIDYPLAGLGLMLQSDRPGGPVLGLRMALTAVNPRPLLVPGLDELCGNPPSLELVDALKQRANRAAKPMRTTVADPAYRRAMVGALVEKAAARLAPELAGALQQRLRWA